jgi:ABC-type maltose transport system permease subunit
MSDPVYDGLRGHDSILSTEPPSHYSEQALIISLLSLVSESRFSTPAAASFSRARFFHGIADEAHIPFIFCSMPHGVINPM